MIDLHSHILPGIDDGAGSLDDSVELVRELAAGGVTDVVATPHYITETIYCSPRGDNLRLVSELQKRLSSEGVDVRVHLGNEIYVCGEILSLAKAGKISGLGGSKYLLVELPMSGEYPGYADIFLEILRSGYKVVLAHPERYTSFVSDFSLVNELVEMGVLLQCNLGSFVGQYGKPALKLARRLAKERLIFALGSDIHHPRGAEFMPAALKKIRKFYPDEAELEQILVENPKKVLGI